MCINGGAQGKWGYNRKCEFLKYIFNPRLIKFKDVDPVDKTGPLYIESQTSHEFSIPTIMILEILIHF